MDEQQVIGLAGQGGAFGALMLVIYKVGMGLVAVIKELRQEIANHTKTDVAAMAEVREDLAALNARIDVIADVTPIRGVPKQSRASTEPGRGGYYSPRKPPREDG